MGQDGGSPRGESRKGGGGHSSKRVTLAEGLKIVTVFFS